MVNKINVSPFSINYQNDLFFLNMKSCFIAIICSFSCGTVPVTSSHVKKLEVTEIKMCRWACGHTLRDHVRNENIKERLKVESIAERCMKARLRWFGHVKRRDQDYLGRQTLEMVPPGRRKKARKTEAEMDGLCQSRHESHRNDERRSP